MVEFKKVAHANYMYSIYYSGRNEKNALKDENKYYPVNNLLDFCELKDLTFILTKII